MANSSLQENIKNESLEQVLSAPALVGDHIVKQGDGKMDGGMKEVFSRIGDKHPGSPLADRFSSGGSNAQKKVTEVAKKLAWPVYSALPKAPKNAYTSQMAPHVHHRPYAH